MDYTWTDGKRTWKRIGQCNHCGHVVRKNYIMELL